MLLSADFYQLFDRQQPGSAKIFHTKMTVKKQNILSVSNCNHQRQMVLDYFVQTLT